jgi:hypothetical protein
MRPLLHQGTAVSARSIPAVARTSRPWGPGLSDRPWRLAHGGRAERSVAQGQGSWPTRPSREAGRASEADERSSGSWTRSGIKATSPSGRRAGVQTQATFPTWPRERVLIPFPAGATFHQRSSLPTSGEGRSHIRTRRASSAMKYSPASGYHHRICPTADSAALISALGPRVFFRGLATDVELGSQRNLRRGAFAGPAPGGIYGSWQSW